MIQFVCPICGTEFEDKNVITDDDYNDCYICSTCLHIHRIEYIGEGVKSESGHILLVRDYDVEYDEINSRWPE